MHEVIEPPGVRRATGVMFAIFAGAGAFASIAIMSQGGSLFALLFGAMFIGIPGIIHRASKGPGVPGFTLSSDGIMGAADDEQQVIPWSEIDNLAWRGTGLEINGQVCLALHAELVDGRSVRVTTYTARRGREVDEVVEQVEATGMLPEGVGFGQGRSRSDRLASGAGGQASAKTWSDLPPGMKLFFGMFLFAFFAPFLVMFAFVPLFLLAYGGVVGWLVTAGLIATVAVFLAKLVRRGHVPLLACSFTVEGVIADHGDGLTIPWQEGVELRVEATVTDDGPLVEAGTGQGWLLELHRPGASPVRLSPPLTSRFGVQRAVGELTNAKRQGLIPANVPLALAPNLPADATRKMLTQWNEN